MTAYNATPTQDLFDLLITRNRKYGQLGGIPGELLAKSVTVALWAQGDPANPCPLSSDQMPTTGIASMSAALYVRLYPHGHHGPVVMDGSKS